LNALAEYLEFEDPFDNHRLNQVLWIWSLCDPNWGSKTSAACHDHLNPTAFFLCSNAGRALRRGQTLLSFSLPIIDSP